VAEIQLKDVTKRYPDGFEAVKHMDLTIGDGEFMILVGPSGCGKSTALRMIAGLEDISEGELLIDGDVVNEKAPKDRDIAMVFQSYALYPHMTVRDNMGFALKLAGVDSGEIDEKVREAARILDLEQHLDRKPANLSGGQRQRVAMGRAIVRSPKAFLMDEPLSNLDAKLRVQTRAEVSRLQDRLGTTTVYVTHDQTEALTLGDRVAVMRAGVLQQVDTPGELYNNPANLFVAGFIGSPAMNFFAGSIEDGKVRLPFGDLPLPQGVQARGPVIAGIRPEDFEDAELAPTDRAEGYTFEAPIELIENLGADLYAHFTYEGGRAESAELSEIAADAGTADVPSASGDANMAVARVSAESKIRQGSRARLWVETSKLHLFDAENGASLRHGSGSAGNGGGGAVASTSAQEAETARREPEERPDTA
jgi:multiple sugar transport system ATP-binding protein